MKQSALWLDNNELKTSGKRHPRGLSFLKLFLRYPIFILVLGPPAFRARDKYAGFNTMQAHFDIWNVLQVAVLSFVALRAIRRLAYAQSILIPKQIQSILKYAFFLGLLFLVSVAYSPGRIISVEYAFLYFLTLACVVEFLNDTYRDPPNWLQYLFLLRSILLVLFAFVLLALLIKPALVMTIVPGAGMRLLGGTVATVPVICPIISIISAYSFVYSLEPRVKAAFFFLVGLAGLAAVQSRGADISLFIVLAALGLGWAKKSKRKAQILIAGFMIAILLAGLLVGAVGGERIWSTFNRGGDIENVFTASGRTDVWKFVIQQSLIHPEGMGYIAGIRATNRPEYAGNLHLSLTYVGGTDNAYMETLADAGWVALALYLIMIAKTITLGWRCASKHSSKILVSDDAHHALRCALLLFMFCLVIGIDGSTTVIPLRQEYYLQNITIAIILGVSASIISASRHCSPSA